MNARADIPPLHRQLMQHDDMLGYKFAPGLKVRIPHEGGGYLVKTNKAGFRCDNEVTAKKTKARRVLVFGDSYTAGDGVSNGKRFSDVVEQTREDTEVLNFGLSGSGTDQQYLIFQKYAEEIEYDAVVISVLVENIERNVAKAREWTDRSGESLYVSKPWFELSSSGDLSLKGVPVPVPQKKGSEHVPDHGGMDVLATARKMVNKLGPSFKDKVQKLTRFQPLPDYDSPDSYGWRLMQAILAKWVAELNKLHVPVMVAVIPVYQYVEKTASYSDVRKRFDEFAKATGAPVHHVIDDLWPYTPEVRRSFRFQSDVHLTPLAHKTIGESIARSLAPLLGGK
jgi:lysophospholipase L1-like esterase